MAGLLLYKFANILAALVNMKNKCQNKSLTCKLAPMEIYSAIKIRRPQELPEGFKFVPILLILRMLEESLESFW